MDNKLLCTEGKATIENGYRTCPILGKYLSEYVIKFDQLHSATVDANDATDKRNAERIVTAWNSHDDLVKALTEVLGWGKTKDGKFTFTTSSQQAEEFKEILQKAKIKP
jgi:hypothetical protein